MNDANYSIRSVQRVCDILDLVQAHPQGLSLVDFAAATGLLNGPVINAAGRTDVVTSQDQVDDLLESLGF